MAQKEVEPTITQTIRYDIGGDEQRIHNHFTDWQNISFKYILLPVWVSSFRYRDKAYNIVINARTGEVQGERPYSAWKITMAVLATIALIAVIVFFANK